MAGGTSKPGARPPSPGSPEIYPPHYNANEVPGPENPDAAPKPSRSRKGSVNGCGDGKELDNLTCAELHQKLKELLHAKGHGGGTNRGIIDRFKGMLEDAGKIGYKKGVADQTHVDQYYAVQCKIQQVIDRIENKNNCKDPPSEAYYWAKKPAPSYREFQDYQNRRNNFAPNAWQRFGSSLQGASQATVTWAKDNAWWILPTAAVGGIILAVPTGGASLVLECAAPDTPIATPEGERPIAEIQPGDQVLAPRGGEIVAVPVLAVSRRAVRDHQVIAVTLANGQALSMSATHPLADGRPLGDLRAGEVLSGVEVLAVAQVPYPHEHTHDILPGSEGGCYLAAGVLVGSSLAPPASPERERAAARGRGRRLAFGDKRAARGGDDARHS